jgi:hypothetical protein
MCQHYANNTPGGPGGASWRIVGVIFAHFLNIEKSENSVGTILAQYIFPDFSPPPLGKHFTSLSHPTKGL